MIQFGMERGERGNTDGRARRGSRGEREGDNDNDLFLLLALLLYIFTNITASQYSKRVSGRPAQLY